MPNDISTGYKPEFALGALYQGMNAANQNMSAEEELIKQFLANQRELQTQPIDIAQKQQNLESEAYKTSPEYQTGMRNTIFGQGKSNLAAGENAELLRPFRERAERRKLETDFQANDMQNQIYQIDQKLGDANIHPQERSALVQERARLSEALMSSPDFLGRMKLKEMGGEISAYLAELRAQAEAEKARVKAEAPPKPLTMSQAEAQMRQRLAQNPNDQEALQFLSEYERFKQSTAPAMADVTFNPENKQLETKRGVLSGRSQTKQEPALPAGWTMK